MRANYAAVHRAFEKVDEQHRLTDEL